jgi:type I restriction enzyme, S subunit
MELKLADRPNDLMPLPQGWTHHPLKAGIILQSGHHVLAIYCNTKGAGVPYLTGPADFPEETIQQTKFTERPTTLCEQGDILVTVKGSGSGSMVKSDATYCISRQLMAIRVRDWDKDFIYYSLLQNASQIRAASTGLIPGLSRSDILDQTLPIPPLPEQRAIAAALNDVDALISGLDQLIAKKRDLKQASLQQFLTGKRRLPGFGEGKEYKKTKIGMFPEDWDVKPLKSISSMSGRIGWQGLKQEEFTFNDGDPFLITGMNFRDGEIRWEEVYHISESRYEEAKNIQLRIGDILMTKDGTIGKLLFIKEIPFPGKASLNSHLLVFRPLNGAYVPEFLFYQLSSKEFADYIDLNKSGSTFFGITQEAVGNYTSFLPPFKEQLAIAKALADMDQEIATLQKRSDKTRDLKQGMMQELLTGRIRLV